MPKPGIKIVLLFSIFFSSTKRAFLFFFFASSTMCLNAQPEWVKQMGGAEGDLGSALSADEFGHIFTIGTFSGTSNFGTYTLNAIGKGDIFITRTNASTGDVDWVKQIGGGNEDNGNAIVCDPFGNVYCTGRFSGTVIFGTYTLTSSGSFDSFLAKLDPITGTIVWVKKISGAGYDGGLAITSDASGNIYTSGYFQGTAIFGTFTLNPVGTNFNIFLMRTDGVSGNVVWAKGYGSSGYSYGTAISCDATGDVYLTGYFESEVTFGTYTLSSVQYQDIFISKHYAGTGNVAWAVAAGGMGNDNGNGIVAGLDGYIYTTGKFEGSCAFGTVTLTAEGSADIFISKHDALTGNLAWTKRFGGNGYEQTNAVTLDANGNLFITGQFNGFVSFENQLLASSGNADIFIVKISSSGSVLWATSMGGISVDSGYGITSGPNDALYCIGCFQSIGDFAGHSLTALGANDIFIIKLNSSTVGIEENKILFNAIQLKPVPFKNELDVVVNNIQSYYLVLTDCLGKNIMTLNSEQSHQKLDLEFLKPGIYFITISEKNGTRAIRKIVKD